MWIYHYVAKWNSYELAYTMDGIVNLNFEITTQEEYRKLKAIITDGIDLDFIQSDFNPTNITISSLSLLKAPMMS